MMTGEQAERLAALARDADFLGPDMATWIERLTPERRSLEQAVRFFADTGDEIAAAELAANVWRLWLMSGDVQEGRALLAIAVGVPGARPSRARALALYADGLLAFRSGAQDESRRANDAALACARAVGDLEAQSLALVGLSRVAFREGDYAAVRSLALQARELVRNLDRGAAVAPLHMLAAGTRLSGDLDAAVALYRESLELNRGLGDMRMVAIELHNLGHVELHRADTVAAERYFEEANTIRNPEDPYDVAMTSLNRAALAAIRGERETAAELLRLTEGTLADASIVLDPDDASEVAWLREQSGPTG